MEKQEKEVASAASPAQAAGASIPSKYKIVFMGDAFVGKTCLINRFIYDTFDAGYQVHTRAKAYLYLSSLGHRRDRLPLEDHVRRRQND